MCRGQRQRFEFAEKLFSSRTSSGLTLREALLTYRWVFPTGRAHWNRTFQVEMSEWFDISSLADTDQEKEGQLEGLRESVEFLRGVVKREVEVLGDSRRVTLGGMSQGMETGLWSLFSLVEEGSLGTGMGGMLGGFIGTWGWLPFASDVEGFRGFTGVGNDGHWIEEPEVFDRIFSVSRASK
ncbi:hypothetical protein BDV06DRAFT_210034 [Aspergillus oleicola]